MGAQLFECSRGFYSNSIGKIAAFWGWVGVSSEETRRRRESGIVGRGGSEVRLPSVGDGGAWGDGSEFFGG